MNLVVTLYLWTVVAATGTAYNSTPLMDWRPIGTFEFSQKPHDPMELCLKAARDLGLEQTRFRCIRTK